MQIRDFRRIRPLISKTAAITSANSFIHSRLDYCNSLFYGPSHYSTHRLPRFKIQLLALSLVEFVHHTSIRFLNLCIGYLLITVLIIRFVASLIVCGLYMNPIILVHCSVCDQILILFAPHLLVHY